MTIPNPMLEIAAKAMSERLSIDLGPDDHCVDRPALLAEVFKAIAAAPLDERVVEAAARALATQRIPAYADDAIWAEDLSALKRREERAERFSDFGMARAALTAAFAALTASD